MRKIYYLFVTILLIQNAAAQNSDSTANSILSDSSKPVVLDEVTIRTKKPLVQLLPDKTIINVDAAVTNTGATILEVLVKSPGVTIDRNGNISLKGRQGVLIMIDGKPAQIAGSDLNNFLSGISASQVDAIEIMDNPSAKFDAAGNAGIINIKTKKNKQDGFNGNLSTTYSQGRYARSFNTLAFNYNTGKINLFANLAGNFNQNFTDLYAIRSYYAEDNKTVTSMLEQPSFFKGKVPSQTVKAGIDYQLHPKTLLGIVFSETGFKRASQGNNNAFWMDESGNTDSLIITKTNNRETLKNFTLNLNARQSFSASSELGIDFDFLGYRLRNNQSFNNELIGAGAYIEDITGHLPSNINIFTGKADYSHVFSKGLKMDVGWKSSHVKTNNRAEYLLSANGTTLPDYNKTNHFLYEENIHAAYINSEKKIDRLSMQAGLRYENTSYDANQLGNPQRKDSSFSRKYDGLFPTLTVGYDLDSNQTLSFSAGRRIDRPPFQTLNPFVFVINKYTYQAGNPFYRPQYTWNFEFSHSYKTILVTSLSYSRTNDYFSQIFLQDSTGIITYTEGNLDHMQNIGLSVALQLSPLHWWSISGQAVINQKNISGFVWDERSTSRVQASFNINNQFIFSNGWSGELSGTYQLKEQELQEITDPTGQLGIGIAKQLFNNKGSIKIAFRDIFYTQAMKGFTVFRQSTEYFKITRDTRALNIAFSYRFGKQSKAPARRNTGGAEEEMRRAGS